MVAIGLLEDDRLLRATLAESLESKGIVVAISAGTAEEFLKSSSQKHIDCAILDLHLGSGATGLDVAEKLLAIYPDTGVVFLTSFEDPRLLNSRQVGLPAGSVYLQKRKVGNTATILAAVSEAIAKAPNSRIAGTSFLNLLNDNQIQLLALVAAGLSNSEISKLRNLSEKSVEAALTRISKALNLKSEPGQNQRVHMARAFFRGRGIAIENW